MGKGNWELCSSSLAAYLRVQRWRLEAELVNVREERSVQLLASRWHVQGALPLLFGHNFCIAWRSCRAGAKPSVSIGKGLHTKWIYECKWSAGDPTHPQASREDPCPASSCCTGCWRWRSGSQRGGGGWFRWPGAGSRTGWLPQVCPHTPAIWTSTRGLQHAIHSKCQQVQCWVW